MKASGLPFRIAEVEIACLGAFPNGLAVGFDDLESPTLLYGGNGVGKTTLLEAASLVGHLPCIPVLAPDGSVAESLLRRVVEGSTEIAVATGRDRPGGRWWSGLTPEPTEDPSSYLRRFRKHLTTSGHSAVRLKVHNGETIELVVLIRGGEHDADGESRPILTPLLSRRDGSGHEFEDDLSLENDLLVARTSSVSAFNLLNDQLFRGRTFSIAGKHHSGDELASRSEYLVGTTGKRRVAYVNTDLNDFGRGNDLRESPKMLGAAFEEQFGQRIRLSFVNGQYENKEALNGHLDRVLPGSSKHYSDALALSDGLRVDKFSRTDEGIVFKASRGAKQYRPQTLSAGENEVLFLFLMCLANATGADSDEHGILLLDEPDLHLATASRARFFREIEKICGDRTQAVIASHSESSLIAFGSGARHLGRRLSRRALVLYAFEPAPGVKDVSAVYDPRYLGALRGMPKVRPAMTRLWIEGSVSPHYGGPVWRALIGVWAWLLTLVVYLMVVVAGLAVLNDILDALGVFDWRTRVESVHAGVLDAYRVGALFLAGHLVLWAAIMIERGLARRWQHPARGRTWVSVVLLTLLGGVASSAIWAIVS